MDDTELEYLAMALHKIGEDTSEHMPPRLIWDEASEGVREKYRFRAKWAMHMVGELANGNM